MKYIVAILVGVGIGAFEALVIGRDVSTTAIMALILAYLAWIDPVPEKGNTNE